MLPSPEAGPPLAGTGARPTGSASAEAQARGGRSGPGGRRRGAAGRGRARGGGRGGSARPSPPPQPGPGEGLPPAPAPTRRGTGTAHPPRQGRSPPPLTLGPTLQMGNLGSPDYKRQTRPVFQPLPRSPRAGRSGHAGGAGRAPLVSCLVSASGLIAAAPGLFTRERLGLGGNPGERPQKHLGGDAPPAERRGSALVPPQGLRPRLEIATGTPPQGSPPWRGGSDRLGQLRSPDGTAACAGAPGAPATTGVPNAQRHEKNPISPLCRCANQGPSSSIPAPAPAPVSWHRSRDTSWTTPSSLFSCAPWGPIKPNFVTSLGAGTRRFPRASQGWDGWGGGTRGALGGLWGWSYPPLLCREG